MGVDAHTPAGTAGTISLVTPHILNLYAVNGTTVQQLTNQSAATSTLTLSFSPLPEPGHLALLTGGLLGLVMLSQRNRS